jgi:hypothetical protein
VLPFHHCLPLFAEVIEMNPGIFCDLFLVFQYAAILFPSVGIEVANEDDGGVA